MKQLIGKLKASYELECSPVAYTAALVEQVLTTDMDLLTFRNQLKQQTRSAQFYFFRMPEADIKQNQRVFAQ